MILIGYSMTSPKPNSIISKWTRRFLLVIYNSVNSSYFWLLYSFLYAIYISVNSPHLCRLFWIETVAISVDYIHKWWINWSRCLDMKMSASNVFFLLFSLKNITKIDIRRIGIPESIYLRRYECNNQHHINIRRVIILANDRK